jgi:hypothetical protein
MMTARPRVHTKRTCTEVVDLAARERGHLHARHGFLVLWVVVVVDDEEVDARGGRWGGETFVAFFCLAVWPRSPLSLPWLASGPFCVCCVMRKLVD